MATERRFIAEPIEVRANGDEITLAGYAAVYDSLSVDMGGWREMIAPGSFARSLNGDIRALYDHNTGVVLGRTKSGTLKIYDDARGLRVEVSPPNTAMARSVVESIRRGDIDQMSFGFRTIKDKWTGQGDTMIRTLEDVELLEVSFVAFPAYPETSAAVRSLAEWRSVNQPGEEKKPAPNFSLLRRRLDLAAF
jgi:HK97 family phage prohead protease